MARGIGPPHAVERSPQPAPANPPAVFPWQLTEGVYLGGYNHENSFGAHRYFVLRVAGNLLIDSPRYARRLVDAFAEMGGGAHVLLSHRDDVAAAERYAQRFSASVWIHDADAAPYATGILCGDDAVEVPPGVRAIPVPGRTRGSVVFDDDRGHLITGDSLAWSEEHRRPVVFSSATWCSWPALTASMARLARAARFEWLLPGHGRWGHAPCDEMTCRLLQLADDMMAHTASTGARRVEPPGDLMRRAPAWNEPVAPSLPAPCNGEVHWSGRPAQCRWSSTSGRRHQGPFKPDTEPDRSSGGAGDRTDEIGQLRTSNNQPRSSGSHRRDAG